MPDALRKTQDAGHETRDIRQNHRSRRISGWSPRTRGVRGTRKSSKPSKAWVPAYAGILVDFGGFDVLSLIMVLLLVAFAWGCGYRTRSDLLRHIDSVTISPIANETVEYGLEDDLEDALRQEFSRHWGEGTDSVFTGAIKMYEILPISLDQNNQPEQYRLVMVMSFVFEDLKRNRILQNEKNYEKIHDFYVVPDRGEPPETLNDARQKLVQEASEDIVSSIVEEW